MRKPALQGADRGGVVGRNESQPVGFACDRPYLRRALAGTDLGQLHAAVEQEFLTLDEHEQKVRSVLAKMESGLIRQMVTFHND